VKVGVTSMQEISGQEEEKDGGDGTDVGGIISL
jgi:hypothetical protein